MSVFLSPQTQCHVSSILSSRISSGFTLRSLATIPSAPRRDSQVVNMYTECAMTGFVKMTIPRVACAIQIWTYQQTFWGARFYPVKFLCADFETAVPFSQGSWRNFFLFKQETKEINQCPAALGILIWTQYPWQQLKLWSVGFGSSWVAVKPDYTHIVTTKQLVTVVSSEFFFLSVMTKGYRLCAIMSSDFCHMWHVCFPETHWYVFPCYFSAGVLYNISVSLVAFTCTWREPAGRSIIQM